MEKEVNSVFIESTTLWFRPEVDNEKMKLGVHVMIARKTER